MNPRRGWSSARMRTEHLLAAGVLAGGRAEAQRSSLACTDLGTAQDARTNDLSLSLSLSIGFS